MFPAGVAAIVLGVLGCWGSAVGERGAAPEVFAAAVLVSMITNPLVFVGFPLGCYWLYRSAKGPARRVSPPSEEQNPKLTHCPDCGKHVSRLAASCPHCGRPLEENQRDKSSEFRGRPFEDNQEDEPSEFYNQEDEPSTKDEF
jgi:rubredoxin